MPDFSNLLVYDKNWSGIHYFDCSLNTSYQKTCARLIGCGYHPSMNDFDRARLIGYSNGAQMVQVEEVWSDDGCVHIWNI